MVYNSLFGLCIYKGRLKLIQHQKLKKQEL